MTEILILTLKCALLSTLFVLIVGLPLAYVLARFTFWGKDLLSSLVSLPLVLPPTAVGYLLLQLLAENGLFGGGTLGFDLNILFTWRAVVLAGFIMSLPLVVRTARVAFENVNPRYESLARTLGFSGFKTYIKFTLPMAYKGLIAAGILGFTRAVGEFGATITLAGNIPGKTQTLASGIYTAQQMGDKSQAYFLLWVSIGIGVGAVFLSEYLSRSFRKQNK